MYSVRIQENTDQKKLRLWTLSRSIAVTNHNFFIFDSFLVLIYLLLKPIDTSKESEETASESNSGVLVRKMFLFREFFLSNQIRI